MPEMNDDDIILNWHINSYAHGKQLNRYPYTSVISDIKREQAERDKNELRVLEIGCGSANNLWAIVSEGAFGFGIDASSTAIDEGMIQMRSFGIPESRYELLVGDARKLPFENKLFDIIIDRAVLGYMTSDIRSQIIRECHARLAPKGKLFSYDLCGESHFAKRRGEKITGNTYSNFSDGAFPPTDIVHFFRKNELLNDFSCFRNIKVKRCTEEWVGGVFRKI